MAITMQGAWTLRLPFGHTSPTRRFVVCGASAGNGPHDGQAAVAVAGAQWSVTLQQRRGAVWQDLPRQRIGHPRVANGLVLVQIRPDDDGPAGTEADAFCLTASLPASADEHVVYGNASGYEGDCLFNPCRNDYIVLDRPIVLSALSERHPQFCAVLAKLYPDRLLCPDRARKGGAVANALTPAVLPTGLPNVANGLVFRSRPLRAGLADLTRDGDHARADDSADEREARTVAALATTVSRPAFRTTSMAAGADRLTRADFATIAAVRDIGVRERYSVESLPRLMLHFQEYERTSAERAGDSYSGTGRRHDVGLAVSDDAGNYLFRFTPSLFERRDVAAQDNTLAPARPDLIVQVLGADLGVRFETAPYANVANLQRIDLCIPAQAERRREPDRHAGAAFSTPVLWRLPLRQAAHS